MSDKDKIKLEIQNLELKRDVYVLALNGYRGAFPRMKARYEHKINLVDIRIERLKQKV